MNPEMKFPPAPLLSSPRLLLVAMLLLLFSSLASATVSGSTYSSNIKVFCERDPQGTWYHSDATVWLRSDMDAYYYDEKTSSWMPISNGQIIDVEPDADGHYSKKIGVVASPYSVRGSFSGYVHHPNIAWYPGDIIFDESYGSWTTGIYEVGDVGCRLKDDVNYPWGLPYALEHWLVWNSAITSSTEQRITQDVNNPGYSWPDIFGITRGGATYDATPYSFHTALICKGEAQIYDLNTNPSAPVAQVNLDANGALSSTPQTRQEMDVPIPDSQSQRVIRLRTDINRDWCALYTRPLNEPQATAEKGLYSTNPPPNPVPGAELTFTLRKKPPAACSMTTISSPSSVCPSPTGHQFTVEITYSDAPAGSTFTVLPDSPGTAQTPNPFSISGSNTVDRSVTYIDPTGGKSYSVFGRINLPDGSSKDCDPHANVHCDLPGPNCQLSVADGAPNALCTPLAHSFPIKMTYSNLPLSPASSAKITCTGSSPLETYLFPVSDSGTSGSYSCDYGSEGTYSVAGSVTPAGSANPVACTPVDVTCSPNLDCKVTAYDAYSATQGYRTSTDPANPVPVDCTGAGLAAHPFLLEYRGVDACGTGSQCQTTPPASSNGGFIDWSGPPTPPFDYNIHITTGTTFGYSGGSLSPCASTGAPGGFANGLRLIRGQVTACPPGGGMGLPMVLHPCPPLYICCGADPSCYTAPPPPTTGPCPDYI
ncbi:Uncharacterised protein [Candidatus Burarchaeum australiense]|nr:Uncharacterised protein [Candidatus Burarchaeum australiense]